MAFAMTKQGQKFRDHKVTRQYFYKPFFFLRKKLVDALASSDLWHPFYL